MKPIVLTDVLAVGEFPSPEQIAILAKAGFKSILNNQPDGEVARFARDADIAVIAGRHGLAHAFAPLSSRTPPADEIRCFSAALGSLPAPIYAFCYSGARSAATCALLMTETIGVGAILKTFADAGFDLEGLRPWLDEARARHGNTAATDDASARPGAPDEAASSAPASKIITSPAIPVELAALELTSGDGLGRELTEPPAQAISASSAVVAAKELPKMIIIQPRAASYGGFAV